MMILFFTEIFYLHFKNCFRNFFNLAPVPYKWLIQLTNDCNSKCLSCDIWKINIDNSELKKQELTLADYEKLFKESGKNLKWLALSGGEISLYKDFTKFLLLVKKYCPSLRMITFTTNGIRADEIYSIAMQIKALKINYFVVISLDGNEVIHDKTRGIRGNYKLATKLFNDLKKAKINVYYGTTLNSFNIEYWKNNLSDEVKSISLIHNDGIYKKSNEINDESLFIGLRDILSKYSVKNFSTLGEFIYLRLALIFLKGKRRNTPIPCNVLSSSLHIYPNGDIHPCMYLPKLGNVKDDFLENLTCTREAQIQRENIKNGHCPKCWMNCYAPHSIIEFPMKSIVGVVKSYF